ncbi:hypothetical protein CEP54_001866 [Fusarium duplospermum]|uniref:Uncharacterized protein n=1 Tax=Fusarium duplospermum TaxID=1325734 RepID=A0A428QYV4_9HYPO|nr:hypothetical protein CEP54_001866 [Fusarium duplospermum]
MSTPQLTVEELLRLREEEIIRFLDVGPSAEFEAGVIATNINELLRELREREGENEDKIKEFLWRLWNLIISIASRIQPDDLRFDMFVLILKRLQHIRSGLILPSLAMAEVWEDMPLLRECMREVSDSSFMTAPSSSPAKWISLQSLFARLYGKGIAERTDLAIWVLREALEETLPPPGPAHDAMLEGSETRTLRVGKLAVGMEPGVTEERWTLWRQRLGLLAKELDQRMKRKVEYAVRSMILLEEDQARKKAQQLKQIRQRFTDDWLAGDN